MSDSPPSPLSLHTELEELLMSLKQVQHCLSDGQSQEDVELVLQLVQKTDFQKAFNIHNAVAQHMNRPSPPFPHTDRAQGLAHEVSSDLESVWGVLIRTVQVRVN